MIREVYKSEEGKKELLELCKKGKVFSKIETQDDLYIHNFIIGELKSLGFREENLLKIINYVLELQPVKENSAEKEVLNNYFGVNPEIE